MSHLKRPTLVDIPYVDDEVPQTPKKSISERKGANLRVIINGDDSDNENEKRDKPGPLISDLCKQIESPPALGLRRNSFSMPTLNEIDLDALRALHMNAMNEDGEESEETEKSKESLNEITVSCGNFNSCQF